MLWGASCPLEKGCAYQRHHFVYPEWHRKSETARQGWALAWSLFLQAHPPSQQLKGSQLSQLNPQRNVLLFGEIPDNTHTWKHFSIPAMPVSGQETHPFLSVLLTCGWYEHAKIVIYIHSGFFSAGFQEWEEKLEKLNAMLHWWGEILCTAILVLTACCGHQAVSSRSFQGAGKEVGCTEALVLGLFKSRRVIQGVCLSCKQWNISKKGSFMPWWSCGKWETTN